MSKEKSKKLIIFGVITLICMVAAVWFSLSFNGGRLVVPMDFAGYKFHFKDIPMILAILIAMVYAAYIVMSVIQYAILDRRNIKDTHRTRKISPKFGYLGFLGFAGFMGVPSYFHDGTIAPFVFFIFFGFFGFFYEGKMSGILADERFKSNRKEAERKALNVGFRLLFLLILMVGFTSTGGWLNLIAILLTCGISLIYGFVIFLSEYLLYRFDQMDAEEWEDKED